MWLVMALFPASLAQAGMYPHGWYSIFKLQDERFFFPVRPIAHEKRRNITQVINIFLFFIQIAVDGESVRRSLKAAPH